MSSPIWTRVALSSEFQQIDGACWRVVEAQHRVSTMKLTDNFAEQALLEDLLEETKTTIPPDCRHLNYLLATPFRYGAAYPTGSRFRRAGHTPGVFYAAERPETAMAELAFHRLLFFADSPATPWPADAAEYTAFSVAISSARLLDLMRAPLAQDQRLWTHLNDYAPCQSFADAARAVDADVIRYQSVRDPQAGANIAILACRAFARPKPIERQPWRMRLGASGVQAFCDFPMARLEFPRDAFAADQRIAALIWERDRR